MPLETQQLAAVETLVDKRRHQLGKLLAPRVAHVDLP
jgi:hypothetical protein